jgi:tetratricopeptide (TPR) repeat protein
VPAIKPNWHVITASRPHRLFAKLRARFKIWSVMKSINTAVLLGFLLAGCAHAPALVVPVVAAPDEAVEAYTSVVDNVDESLPKQVLTSDLLYEYLMAEIGNQRGYKMLAVNNSTSLAKKTRDPRVAKRAAQLAFESGDMDKSITALTLWQELEPGALLANRLLASILLRGGKLEQAQKIYTQMLQADVLHADANLLQIEQSLASYPDKKLALEMMRELAQPYENVSEGHWSVAQLAYVADETTLALAEVRRARELRADWDMAASLEAVIVQKTAPLQGLQILHNYVLAYPNNFEVRAQYARALLEQKNYSAARDEFQKVAEHNPNNPDLAFTIALISLQMNDFVGAETQLKAALNKGKKDQDTVQYYLGQLSEAKKNPTEAIAYYQAVKGGEQFFVAQLRIAALLAEQGKLSEARQVLQQQKSANNQQRAQLVLVEAQLLREAKNYPAALQVLEQGLEKLPNHNVLLYEAAMMADKVGKFDLAEQQLRKLMQMNPQDANAYNALGYSFLERNVRVNEGVALVEKALQLAPDDVSIMDSVGFGYYRSGKWDDSVALLRRAYAGNPDPEIATHLVQALWARGDKVEAQQLLQDSLKAHPDNQQLLAVQRTLTQ